MLEDEIRRLTAAVEILTAKLDTFVIPVQTQKNQQEENVAPPTKSAKGGKRNADPVPAPEKIAEPAEKIAEPPAPAPADPAPSISKENLKAMALSISRADTSAKPQIFEILGKYGAKTITALPDDPDVLHDVFTGFTKIANKIAKDGE